MISRKSIVTFATFVIVGVANTLVDFAVLNLLLLLFGVGGTLEYTAFKTVSFAAAAFNSYFLNRRFTFRERTSKTRREMYAFMATTVMTFLVSTAVSAFAFSFFRENTDLSPKLAANVAALIGIIVNVFCNFLGYSLLVFRKKQ